MDNLGTESVYVSMLEQNPTVSIFTPELMQDDELAEILQKKQM